jgi:hypothetical protein
MAAEATAANLAAEGTSAGASAITAAGAAIKAFVLANPAALAGIAGIVIGALGYRVLANRDHEHDHEGEDEAAETAEAAEAAEAPAS